MSIATETGGETPRLGGHAVREPSTAVGLPTAEAGRSKEPPTQFGSSEPRTAIDRVQPPVVAAVRRHGLLQAFQSLLNVIVVALFILAFTVQPFRIPSASMEPTLLVGDFLLVDKQVGPEVFPRIFPPTNVIRRGDIIVFHYPLDPSMHLVKRVVGLPGDRVRMKGGHVYIDGRALGEPYTIYRPSAPDSFRDDFPRMDRADPGVDSRWWIQMRSLVSNGEVTIPPHSYFVLGDNRNDSEDSRYWGLVPRDAIVGKPFLVYFSLNDPSATPGQVSAAAMSGSEGGRSQGSRGSLADFARWDRTLHVVY